MGGERSPYFKIKHLYNNLEMELVTVIKCYTFVQFFFERDQNVFLLDSRK